LTKVNDKLNHILTEVDANTEALHDLETVRQKSCKHQ